MKTDSKSRRTVDPDTRKMVDAIDRAIRACDIRVDARPTPIVRHKIKLQRDALEDARAYVISHSRDATEAEGDIEFRVDWLPADGMITPGKRQLADEAYNKAMDESYKEMYGDK